MQIISLFKDFSISIHQAKVT